MPRFRRGRSGPALTVALLLLTVVSAGAVQRTVLTEFWTIDT